ncbi:hypothetical protein HDU91_005086 [Kappamyces sp. JEL0680]|nr:hypothetical protein HDU91_005086 [Kappamyces sp. JEL0680]
MNLFFLVSALSAFHLGKRDSTALAAAKGSSTNVVNSSRLETRNKSGQRAQAAPSNANVQYFGGPMTAQPKVFVIYWGGKSKVAYSGQQLETFYNQIMFTPWFNVLTKDYSSPSRISPGRVYGTLDYYDAPAKTQLLDSDIGNALLSLVQSGRIPVPDQNFYYAVHLPYGYTALSIGKELCVDICAFHWTMNYGSTELVFGVIPDMQTKACQTSCGPSSTDYFQNVCGLASHELAEAIVDPGYGVTSAARNTIAWIDRVNGEIGDICNAQYGSTRAPNGLTYTVQKLYSNSARDCVEGLLSSSSSFLTLQNRWQMKLAAVFSAAVSATYLFLESQWIDSESCSGAPDSVIAFVTNDPGVDADYKSEYWPVMWFYYWDAITNYQGLAYPRCGPYIAPDIVLENDCCVGRVDSDMAMYASGEWHLVTDQYELDASDPLAHLPATANGATFCSLAASAAVPQNSTLYGFKNALYRANGRCIDDSFICMANGTLVVFQNGSSGCNGPFETFQLTSTSQAILSMFLGPVSGALLTVYLEPDYMVVPQTSSPLEIITLTLFIVSVLVLSVSLLLTINSYRSNKHINIVYSIVSQIVWLVYVVIKFQYDYTVYLDAQFDAFLVTRYFVYLWSALAPLTTILLTTNYLVLYKQYTGAKKYACFGLAILVHLVTKGLDYARFDEKWPVWYREWRVAGDLVHLSLVFAYSYLPACIIVYRALELSKTPRQLWVATIHKINPFLGFYFVCEAFVLVFFIISYLIRSFSPIPGSDRNYLALGALLVVWQSLRKSGSR